MSNNKPEPLKVFASEDVKSKDVPPGSPMSSQEEKEKLPPEEVEKRRKIMSEYTRLLGRYCPPHNKKSRWVKESDMPILMADGRDLVAMCNLPRGKYSGISALAHSQIEDKDPLRFFVFPKGLVIINPVITAHTKAPIFKTEGCMSYPDEEAKIMVPRYNKVTATYQTLARKDENSEPVLSGQITEELNGGAAHVFQHECGHLNGCNIYDKDYDPEKSIGLGDGLPIALDLWGKVEDNKNNKK